MYVTAREARLDAMHPEGAGELCEGFQCLTGWRWQRGVKSEDIKDSPLAEKQYGYCGYGGEPSSNAKQPDSKL